MFLFIERLPKDSAILNLKTCTNALKHIFLCLTRILSLGINNLRIQWSLIKSREGLFIPPPVQDDPNSKYQNQQIWKCCTKTNPGIPTPPISSTVFHENEKWSNRPKNYINRKVLRYLIDFVWLTRPFFFLVVRNCVSKFVICYIFLPFSSVEAEMAQVQVHRKVTSKCPFDTFDSALEY